MRNQRRRAAWGLCVLLLWGCDEKGTTALPTLDAAAAGDATVTEGALRPVTGTLRPLLLGAQAFGGDFVAVGGTPGPNGGVAVRLSGDRIVPEATPTGGVLWWVFGLDGERLWACGEGGRVLARADGRWQAEATGLPTGAVLWGLWGATAQDRWAVGGSPLPGGPKGIVLRDVGAGWGAVEVPAEARTLNVYKVWGTGAGDVHFVGEGGLALRWDGVALRRVPTPTTALLFTVHGRADGPIFAVGGTTAGVILRWQDDAWVDDSVEGLQPLNGVFVRSADEAWATGTRGTVLRWTPATGWTRRTDAREGEFVDATLHAVTAGDDVWAVGGDLTTARFGTVVTTRRPVPTVDDEASWDAGVQDAALTDAAPPDAAPNDAGPRDATPRDATPGDAAPGDAAPSRDAVADGSTADAAGDPARDAAPTDAAPIDGTAGDAGTDDAALPRPRWGQRCDQGVCADDLECLPLAAAGYQPYCVSTCARADDCPAALGARPCCQIPGPQLLQTYCLPPEAVGGCGM